MNETQKKTIKEVMAELAVMGTEKNHPEEHCAPSDAEAENRILRTRVERQEEMILDLQKKLSESESRNIELNNENSIWKKSLDKMAPELNASKTYVASLEDKVEDLKAQLATKHDLIAEAVDIIRPLLDADSGADLHDVAEHIMALFSVKPDYTGTPELFS